jgi:succinate dehydrogenase hydrophobic anchor subunit
LSLQSSNNIVSHTKRAVTTALVVSFGGIGGIFATTIFRQADFPRYLPGIYATISCQILLLVLLAITSIHFWLENRRILAEKPAPMEGKRLFLYTL